MSFYVRRTVSFMSRKSRATLSREKLESISSCPTDIFNSIEATDELFELIEKAERKDEMALRKISSMLFSTYINDSNINQAMLYFLVKGVEHGDTESAHHLIVCASMKNECLEHVDDAVKVLNDADLPLPPEHGKDAMFKSIVRSAGKDADYETLLGKLYSLQYEGIEYAELYFLYKQKEAHGNIDAEKADSLSAQANLPPLSTLPTFCDTVNAPDSTVKDGWSESLISALNLSSLDSWQDFWLRCIYEYCVIYLKNDFTEFAEAIAQTLEKRRFSKKSKLHALAFIKYIRENTPEDNHKHIRLREWYNEMLEECVLDGTLKSLDDEEEMLRIMKEAAYTSEYAERKSAESGISLGHRINHVKNRYVLCAVLTDHAKRGNRHMWPTVLSIKQDSDALPIFENIKIAERRNEVRRGDAALSMQKKQSQVICDGNLILNGKVSPFVLDLILDISYVSTTKCESLEIKIKKAQKNNGYTVLNCQLFIY